MLSSFDLLSQSLGAIGKWINRCQHTGLDSRSPRLHLSANVPAYQAGGLHWTCLPSPADNPPSGANWIHEIKQVAYSRCLPNLWLPWLIHGAALDRYGERPKFNRGGGIRPLDLEAQTRESFAHILLDKSY